MSRGPGRPSIAFVALLAAACGAGDPASAPAAAPATAHCLPEGAGFLRARVRGAFDADLDWRDAQIQCEGGARPDGAGVRVSIVGPLPAAAGLGSGRTLRFVFGIDAAPSDTEGAALPTNLTAIVEGGDAGDGEMFATRGDDKCTTDAFRRRNLAGPDHRVEARGFCLGPASTLDGAQRLLVTTFDFAGRITLEPR